MNERAVISLGTLLFCGQASSELYKTEWTAGLALANIHFGYICLSYWKAEYI